MVSLITTQEIEEIFTNFERLKKKTEGSDNSVETRVSHPSPIVSLEISFCTASLTGPEEGQP